MDDPEDAQVVLTRSAVHHTTWVCTIDGVADSTSFLHAGPLRVVQRWANERWSITRWTREDHDTWLGWT